MHDIGLLTQLAQKGGVVVPQDVMDADILTDYATIGRYPGHRELEESDHTQATAAATTVVKWAARLLDE